MIKTFAKNRLEDMRNNSLEFGDVVVVGWSSGYLTLNIYLGHFSKSFTDEDPKSPDYGKTTHYVGYPEFLPISENYINSIIKNGIYPNRINSYTKYRIFKTSKEALSERDKITYDKLINLIKHGNTGNRN